MNLSDDARAEEELRRALETCRPETIAHAAMSNIWPLYAAHFDLLVRAIEGLPSAVLDRYPVLRSLHRLTPVLASTSRPFKPLMYPESSRGMSADEIDVMILSQMVSFRYSGDVSAAVVYARRLQERLSQAPLESRERVDGPLWFYHHQLGSTFLAAGDSARALLEFTSACQVGRISRQDYAERVVLGRVALAHAVRGSLEEAELALTRLRGLPEPTAAHASASASSEGAAAALIAVERMSPDAEQRIAHLESYDSLELSWPFALLARIRALLARQRPDEAREAVQLASDSHPVQHGSFAADVLSAMTIETHLAAGDSVSARGYAEMRDQLGRNSGVLTTLALARVALDDSRFERANHLVRSILSDPLIGPGPRLEAQLLAAWAIVAERDELDSATARRIIRFATSGDGLRALATVPTQLIALARVEAEDKAEASAFDAATAGLAGIELFRRPRLTAGEMRVLGILPTNPTTRRIAGELHISPNTVKSQLTSLYRKLGCSTREDAVRLATRYQLIDPTV